MVENGESGLPRCECGRMVMVIWLPDEHGVIAEYYGTCRAAFGGGGWLPETYTQAAEPEAPGP